MPSLDDLRARKVTLPKATRTVTLVEGQHLLDASQRLANERNDLLVQAARKTEDGEPAGPPPKAGERTLPPRVAQIDAEQLAISERLAEYQAEIELVGFTGGEWQQYKDDHPAREDNDADLRVTQGWCNATDLFNDLGRFVAKWDGEPVPKGDWDGWLAEQIIYADRRDLVTDVVNMHERSLPRAPKSPSDSSTTPDGSPGSDSPAT